MIPADRSKTNSTSKKQTPVGFMLSAISIFTTLLAISSFFDGIVTWYGLIDKLIKAYRDLIYPLYYLLFSCFPFKVPSRVIDYLNIGCIIGFSSKQAMDEKIFDVKIMGWYYTIYMSLKYFLVAVLLWPGWFVEVFIAGNKDYLQLDFRRKAWKWLFTVLICFVFIVILNYVHLIA